MQEKALIIVPCYNEANRLDVDSFNTFLLTESELDFCFVNDGSIDNTLEVLKTLASNKNAYVLHLATNVGKAEAIRQGVLQFKDKNYAHIGYLDADLSTSLKEIKRLYNLKDEHSHFILGSRFKKMGSSIKRSKTRHFFGRIVATFVDSMILKLGIYDTQCGAKIIKTDLAKTIFKDTFKTKWLFDIELLARTKKQFGKEYCKKHIVEVPLTQWIDNEDTRITFLDFLKTPFALVKLYFNYK